MTAGRLVTRPVEESHGKLRLVGGSSYQVIRRPSDVVWRALLDTKHYPKMIPTLSKARELSRGSDSRVVRCVHHAWPVSVEYNLNLRLDTTRQGMRFILQPTETRGPRAAWGSIALSAYGDGRTLLTYRVMADPGGGVATRMLRGVVHEWLLRVPEQMKRFIESETGRNLYLARR